MSVSRVTWIDVVSLAAPYLAAVFFGACLAWWVQDARVRTAKADAQEQRNRLAEYKAEQQRLKNEADIKAESRRLETINEYQKKLDALAQDHDTYKRCVAAGRCGARVVRVPDMSDGAGLRVPPAGRAHEACADAVPSPGGNAAEDGVLKDCAYTTLQLNQLQADIESQRR